MERRTLIRLLVGFGIGIPILIELATFLGLIEQRFFTGESDDRTPTPAAERVGVGDDLLPETEHEERLLSAVVQSEADAWPLTLTVEVVNLGNDPYEFRLGTVTTGGGRRIEGGGSTGPIPAGGDRVITGRWTLPAGSTPDTVAATGIVVGDGTEDAVTRSVPLAKIPVSGG